MRRSTSSTLTLLALVALVPALASCRRMPWAKQGISFEQFVQATVALRQAATSTSSTAEFEARKKQVLTRLRVTESDLRGFVSAHGSDVKLMSAAWDSVEARLSRAPDTTSARRTRPPAPTPVPARPGRPPQRPASSEKPFY